jgi:hypothetical protein
MSEKLLSPRAAQLDSLAIGPDVPADIGGVALNESVVVDPVVDVNPLEGFIKGANNMAGDLSEQQRNGVSGYDHIVPPPNDRRSAIGAMVDDLYASRDSLDRIPATEMMENPATARALAATAKQADERRAKNRAIRAALLAARAAA